MPLPTAKQLVRASFQRRELGRPPFVPIVTSFAARLAQLSVRELLENPTKLANTLQSAQRLLGYDAIVSVYDPTLEAEACGCAVAWPVPGGLPTVADHPLAESPADLDLAGFQNRGRLPVAMEATKRIVAVAGRDVGVIGATTGPLTLAVHLAGEEVLKQLEGQPREVGEVLEAAGKVFATVCRMYCDLKVDAVLVVDELLALLDRSALAAMAPLYLSAANIVRFYDAALVLMAGSGANGVDCRDLGKLECDAVVLEQALPGEPEALAAQGKAYGIALPLPILGGTKEQAVSATQSHLERSVRKGFFVTTSGEVPFATPAENLHEVVRTVRKAQSDGVGQRE